jgi:hypothetical protein
MLIGYKSLTLRYLVIAISPLYLLGKVERAVTCKFDQAGRIENALKIVQIYFKGVKSAQEYHYR